MNWDLKSFDEIGFIGRGKSRHRPRNAEHLYGGEYPFVQTGDIKAAGFRINNYTQTYNEAGLAQSKLWKEGTLCITIAANIADTTILGMDACFPDSVIGFVAEEHKCDVRFVKYFFDIFQARMKSISTGAAQDNLSLQKLLTFKIPTPLLPTQRKIASILSAYDDLIENNLKRIKLLGEKAAIAYKSEFGDYQVSNKEFSSLPKGWCVKSIGDIYGKLESGSRPKGGIDKELKEGIASVGAENVIGLGKYNYQSEKLITEAFFENMNRGKIEDRDILIYKDGAYIGKTTLFQDEFPHEKCCVNEHVFLLTTADFRYQYFLFFTLNQGLYFEKMQQLNANAAQPGINQESLKSLKLIWPSVDTVEEFNKEVETSIKLIFVLAKQNTKLREARDILLPRLMKGQIEV
ncbi:MAG: restriction endonuclease subunit S [Methylobacter sp.]|nr:restriction endonuclease subunit S [Methylobacter sp.]